MEYGILIAVVMVAMAGLGGWIASQKKRDTSEGIVLGLLFGPLGVLIEALLPNAIDTGSTSSGLESQSDVLRRPGRGSTYSAGPTSSRPGSRSIDQEGQIAYIADRFIEALEQADPNWRALSPRKKKNITWSVENRVMKELKLSPTAFSELAAEARRSLAS